jgi:tRNA dimethylallyltransferase
VNAERPGPVLALVGPTAAGKTALALELAPALGAEIVSADAMLVYRGMDIGTAKPTPKERARVRHHLVDLVDPSEEFSVARFQPMARAAIADVLARGRLPLLVGGSGLYFHSVVDEFVFPPTERAVRRRLEAEAEQAGLPLLYRRLLDEDPEAAARVQPANLRRIVRALEVIELTGEPFRARLPEPTPYYPLVGVGLDRDPAELDERIAVRVDRMWTAGFVAEVEALVVEGLREGPTASRALGYAQVLAQFDGTLSPEEARERTVTTTRRFVRRQRSWFRRDATLAWFDAARPDLLDAVTAHVGARTIGA